MIITNQHLVPTPIADPNPDRSIPKSDRIDAIGRRLVWCTIIPRRPTSSRANIEMTSVIVEAAKPLGISAHDHIIVFARKCARTSATPPCSRPMGQETRTSPCGEPRSWVIASFATCASSRSAKQWRWNVLPASESERRRVVRLIRRTPSSPSSAVIERPGSLETDRHFVLGRRLHPQIPCRIDSRSRDPCDLSIC
jgi:hypothetical protein